MNKTSINFFKHKLINSFSNLQFYFIGIIFNFVLIINFFFFKKFFSGIGSTNLYNLFSSIPIVSSFVIPFICYKFSKYPYDTFIPIKNEKRIFLEFLTVFIQFVLMCLPLIFIPICVNFFGKVEWGQVVSSFIMIFLFASASISITVFLNLLFSSVIALVLSSFILLVSNAIHLLNEYVFNILLLSNFIKLISFSWHFDSASKGILDSKDIIYYLIITLLFLVLSFIVYEKKIEHKFSKNIRIQCSFFFLWLILLFLNSTRYSFKIDLTSSKKLTISNYSKQILDAAQEKINITYYRSKALYSLFPQGKEVEDFLKEFTSNKNASLKIKDPAKENINYILENYGIYPNQIKTVGNNKTEYVNIYSAIVIEYLGNWEVIPFVISSVTLEYDLIGRIEHLITENKRIVNIICGNGLSLDNDYSYVIPWLNSQGFICNDIKLNEDILNKFDYNSKLLLILGSDKFTDSNCADIELLMQKGIKVLFAVSPYSCDITNSWNITKPDNQKLIQMIKSYGIDFSFDLVADTSCAKITMENHENNSLNGSVYKKQINYPLWINLLPQNYIKQGMTLFWPVEVKGLEEGIDSILYSSDSAFKIKKDEYNKNSLFNTNPFNFETYSFDNFEKQKQSLCLKLNGNFFAYYQTGIIENLNAVIIPDQYFVHSLMLGYIGGTKGDYRNLDFLVNQLLRLNEEEQLATLHLKISDDNNQLFSKIIDEKDFINAKNKTYVIIFVIIPFIYILSFIIVKIVKNKKLKKLYNLIIKK